MHRRIWLLAGAAAAVLVLTASATATSRTASTAKAADATPAAAPFNLAHIPRTPAARKAKQILVGAIEQDVNGFNNSLSCCNQLVGNFLGVDETQYGALTISDKLEYLPSVATKVTATKSGLSYTINPKAVWYWGGKKIPVTYKDFVYTWKQIVNPKNDVVGRDGYDLFTGFTHKGNYQVTFKWKKPYADYRELFLGLFPAAALKGMDFNKIWTNCICGSDGKPVSNGPFYLSNYTKGKGVTLKANPFWWGKKQGLKEIDFQIITDTNSEIQAMRGGEVDVINPSPQTALAQLRTQKNLVYSSVPGLYQEHVDMQFGPKASNVLLRAPWMRQALMMGMDRPGLIKALFGSIAPGLKPLDSLVYYQIDKQNYKPDFGRWAYNQSKALALLKKHCTGGPDQPTAGNTKFFTCAGLPAKFRWTTTSGNQRRETSYAIQKAKLAEIGVQITDALAPANVAFGPTVLEAGNYDLFEFAWVTTPDPAGFVSIWSCPKNGGESNYLGYCNKKVTDLLNQTNTELNPAKRGALFAKADKLMARDVPSVPLYAVPSILVYKKGIKGMTNNPSSIGFTWNTEDWRWSS